MKPGRPRKQNAERKPSGKLRHIPVQSDETPEMRKRRLFYTGGSRRGDAESPMGVLVAHFPKLELDAIREQVTTPYMKAMKKCFGSYGPAVPGDGTERGHDSSTDDGSEAAARKFIKRCDKVLNRLRFESSREIFDAFIVREIFPVWMAYTPGRSLVLDAEYNFELKLILRILELLAEEFHVTAEREYAPMVVVRNYNQSVGEFE